MPSLVGQSSENVSLQPLFLLEMFFVFFLGFVVLCDFEATLS